MLITSGVAIPNTIRPGPCLLPALTKLGELSTIEVNKGSSAGVCAQRRWRRAFRQWDNDCGAQNGFGQLLRQRRDDDMCLIPHVSSIGILRFRHRVSYEIMCTWTSSHVLGLATTSSLLQLASSGRLAARCRVFALPRYGTLYCSLYRGLYYCNLGKCLPYQILLFPTRLTT